MSPPSTCSISGFTLRSLISLGLMFMEGGRCRSKLILRQVNVQFSQDYFPRKGDVLPPGCIFSIFVSFFYLTSFIFSFLFKRLFLLFGKFFAAVADFIKSFYY